MSNKKCDKCEKLNSISAKYCSQCGYELLKEPIIVKEEAKAGKQTLGKKNKFLPVIIGVLAFVVSYFAVQKLFNNEQTIDNTLMQVASEINKSCPIMVDSDTRLDNSVALPNKVFQYNYTLVNLEKSEINIDELEQNLESILVSNVKTSPDMKAFRDKEVTMAYHYKDKNGIFVLKLNITPEKYK